MPDEVVVGSYVCVGARELVLVCLRKQCVCVFHSVCSVGCVIQHLPYYGCVLSL